MYNSNNLNNQSAVDSLQSFFSDVENLFTALSSCCDIMKQMASFIAIKFTKQE